MPAQTGLLCTLRALLGHLKLGQRAYSGERTYKLWSRDEDQRLLALVKQHGFDWPAIVEQLGGDRHPCAASTRYFEVLSGLYGRARFTAEEDRLLLDIIPRWRAQTGKKAIVWSQLAPLHWPKRSPQQLSRRLSYLDQQQVGLTWTAKDQARLQQLVASIGRKWTEIAPKMANSATPRACKRHFDQVADIMIKGRWQADEIERLKQAVEIHGKQWSTLARHVGTRTALQCFRYFLARNGDIYHNKAVNIKAWTDEEYVQLLKLYDEYKGDWDKIAANMGERSAHACQTKYKVELKKLKPRVVMPTFQNQLKIL